MHFSVIKKVFYINQIWRLVAYMDGIAAYVWVQAWSRIKVIAENVKEWRNCY
jgi:hypothetical protein